MIKNYARTNSHARRIRELLTATRRIFDSQTKSLARICESAEISTIVDVGANVGQFGIDMRRHGFKGQIISFEPVNETFTQLSETVKKYRPWKAIQLCLGANESDKIINVSGNSGLSSSLLEMKSVHLSNFPESATVATEKVTISTVDRQLDLLGIDPRDIMLKLDVQGYEAEVLKGASQSLSKIPLCYLEVSITPLYEGEISFLPILIELSKFGHEVIDVFRGIKAKEGQLLQLDILTKLSK